MLSAASIREAMDKDKYEVVNIGITREGRWVTAGQADSLLYGSAQQQLATPHKNSHRPQAGGANAGATRDPAFGNRSSGALAPFLDASPASSSEARMEATSDSKFMDLDIVFPVLHGTFGEDGTIQGLLEMADIAYVGAGVLGSAAGMDKDVMKRLFAAAGLPIVRHVTIRRRQWQKTPAKCSRLVEENLRYPVFVKPANLGSSVGISKARDGGQLGVAIDLAAAFDRKIVIEEGVGGQKAKAREIECAVLGNDNPEASIAGEVVPAAEFYDYAAKYLDGSSELRIPAQLIPKELKEVQTLAIRAFEAVDCAGLARVDFLMHPRSRKIYVNEINTMPGFTAISMYPKLWAASGLKYSNLIDRLIQLGLESYAEKKKNRYSM